MNRHHYILKTRALNERGQKREYSRFSYGNMAHARKEAEKYRDNLIVNGFTGVRVEIWQVIATDYKGTIRG